MTNFDFLTQERQFSTFADACIEAEKSISVSPALPALGVRKSAELAVKWLYSVDDTLKMPYKDNFSALVYNPSSPKTDVDHNTYDFFDLENDMPTFAYEYEQALQDGYLVNYHCIEKLYNVPTKGIS